ncbi:MAG: ABC transporter ATP-binding protein [Clostridia bacterium]|nr:ABC transporter ATP-binding protein [Clostridia bacterium]
MARRNKYDVDEELEKGFDFRKLKRAIVYVKPYKFKMIGALLLSMLSAVLALITPTLLQRAMDIAIPNKDTAYLVELAVMTLVVILLSSAFGALRGVIMSYCGQSMIYDIRRDLFSHLQKLSFSYYDSRPHGKILVRVVNYVNSVSDTLTNGIINAILDVINIALIAVFMFAMNAQLALVILAGMPVLLVVVFLLKNVQKRANFIFNNKNSNLTAYTCESIEGVKVSQIFNRQEENRKVYDELNQVYQKTWFKTAYLGNVLSPVTENLKQIVLAFVYVAGILWISPSIEIGVLIAMGTYASRFWQPVLSLANIYNNFLKAMSYLERIFQTMDEPVEIKDGPEAKALPDMRGEVEFRDVCFEYERDVRVLNHVNFSVKQGESVALVGPTGSGKSTIVNLISRFYDITDGEIRIDGVSISDISVESLRSQMGIMLQDSFIFTDTIAGNIRYGRLDATDEEIREAARAVCADAFISEMPLGYDTPVNERGGQLSQGQRQLIAFARTMVSNPKILVLDEATSSIDAKTERLLQKGIETILKGRTSFVIAHRLSTIKNCDKIMYIDGGQIRECGTHDELMAKKGLYYKLATAQDA